MPIVLDFESAVDANLDAQADFTTDDIAAEAASSEVESTVAESTAEADAPADVTATEQSTETPTEAPAAAAATDEPHSQSVDLLDQISNAERECAEAEAVVNELKEDLKAAKKRYDARVDRLRSLARQSTYDADRPLLTRTKTARQEATDVSPDGAGEAITSPGCDSSITTPAADPDAWKLATIDQIGLKEALTERLIEAGLTTIGKLEAFRAEAADHRASWPKGIGTAKITLIEDAVVAWLTKHRDSHLFNGGTVEVEPADPVAADAAAATAEWEAMSHDDQCVWLNARAVELDNDDVDELDLRDTENEEAWQAGVDSYDADDTASNCPYGPGVDCDAWLQGWLWQGKQETEDAA